MIRHSNRTRSKMESPFTSLKLRHQVLKAAPQLKLNPLAQPKLNLTRNLLILSAVWEVCPVWADSVEWVACLVWEAWAVWVVWAVCQEWVEVCPTHNKCRT